MGRILRVQHLRRERNNRSSSLLRQDILRDWIQRSRNTAGTRGRQSHFGAHRIRGLRNYKPKEIGLRKIHQKGAHEGNEHLVDFNQIKL